MSMPLALQDLLCNAFHFDLRLVTLISVLRNSNVHTFCMQRINPFQLIINSTVHRHTYLRKSNCGSVK